MLEIKNRAEVAIHGLCSLFNYLGSVKSTASKAGDLPARPTA